MVIRCEHRVSDAPLARGLGAVAPEVEALFLLFVVASILALLCLIFLGIFVMLLAGTVRGGILFLNLVGRKPSRERRRDDGGICEVVKIELVDQCI